MRTRVLASICAIAGLVSAGCLDNSTGIGCQQVGTLVTSTSGDTMTTVSGLRYIDTEVGAGAAAQSCQLAKVNYVGQLTDGSVFDQSQGPIDVIPGTFGAIPGFEQGIVGMNVGGKRRLIIPPALAYGSSAQTDQQGNVIIPANSTIIFDVELVSVGDVATQ